MASFCPAHIHGEFLSGCSNTVYKRTIFVHLLVLEIGTPSDLNVSKYFKLFFEVRLVFK